MLDLKFNYFSRSIFGSSLVESGEALKSMADLKYALDDNVKQNYLEPLHHLQSKDLKEVSHHRKKLQGRKLDYDCKKRQGVTEKELKQAEDKFAESLHLAQMGKSSNFLHYELYIFLVTRHVQHSRGRH